MDDVDRANDNYIDNYDNEDNDKHDDTIISGDIYKHDIHYNNDNCAYDDVITTTTRSTQRAQTSLAEADHYSHILPTVKMLSLGCERLPP